MRKFTTILVTLATLLALTSKGAVVTFSVTNYLGQPDTNVINIFPLAAYVNSDGSIQTVGLPTQLPVTNGFSAISLLPGNYLATNGAIVSTYTGPGSFGNSQGILFAVPATSGTYPVGLISIPGYNVFNYNGATLTNGTTAVGISNALGYLPLTPQQTTNAINAYTNTSGVAIGLPASGANTNPIVRFLGLDSGTNTTANNTVNGLVTGVSIPVGTPFDASKATNATPLAQMASPNTVTSSNQVSQIVSNNLGGVLPFTIGPGMTPGAGTLSFAMYMTNHLTAFDSNGVSHASMPAFEMGPRQDLYGNGWNTLTVSKDFSELNVTNPPWTFTNSYALMVRGLWPPGTNTVAGEPGGHAQENTMLVLGQGSGDASLEVDCGGHMNSGLDLVSWGDNYGFGPSTLFPQYGIWMVQNGTNNSTQGIYWLDQGTPAGGIMMSIQSAQYQNPSFTLTGPFAKHGDTTPTTGGKIISEYLTGDMTIGARVYIGGYETNYDGQIFLSGNYNGTVATAIIDANELGNLSVVPPTGATVSIGAFVSGGTSMVNVDGNVTVGTNAYQGGVAPANGLLVEGGIVSSNAVTAAQFNGSAAGLTNIYASFPYVVAGGSLPNAVAEFSYFIYGWKFAGAGGGAEFPGDIKALRAGITTVVDYYEVITTNAGTCTATVYNTVTTNTFGATIASWSSGTNFTWTVPAGTNSTLLRAVSMVPFNVATNAMGRYSLYENTCPLSTNVWVVSGSSRQDIQ